MIAYNLSYDPPAPLLQVTVTSTLNRRLRHTVVVLLDTGADVTAIPQGNLDRLQLYPIRQLQFEDLSANTNVLFTYKVRLLFAGIVIPQLEVVLTGLEFAVIGRDVLNRFNLHLYGPQLEFDLHR